MYRRPRIYSAIILFVAALSMAAFFSSSAVAAGRDTGASIQAEIDSLNALMEEAFRNIPPAGKKMDEGLLDLVYEKGSVPVIARLRDRDLPYGFFADSQKPRSEVIETLQGTVLAAVIAQTSGDEAALHVKRFQLLPAIALQVDVWALEALLAHPNVIDIVEDIPVPPALDVQRSAYRRRA